MNLEALCGTVKQDIEQFRCRTLYFNCYLDRILLLTNCIGPKARDPLISWIDIGVVCEFP
jgi:hypothetical protein